MAPKQMQLLPGKYWRHRYKNIRNLGTTVETILKCIGKNDCGFCPANDHGKWSGGI